jgi:UDP-N-acetylmuramoyl-tripeptide--D-alanyl-D-alanine ligase
MGEHYPGDIKELTNIVHPSITVVTGINEAHLDRFGTIDSLTTGICEAIDGTLMQGVVILNADNERVVNAYSSHIGSRRVLWYSAHNNSKCLYSAEKIHFHIDGTGHTFEVIKDSVSLGPLSVQLLGGYAIGVALCALEVADLFSIPIRDVREGLRTFESVSHRLEPIKTSNALVIDDSYNGNPEGVKYAIEALSKFEGRRKVYVTPGLVELGTESERIHIEIGKHLAVVVDIVVLIKNSVTPFIAKGLVEGGFKGQTLIYESAVEAHKSMAELVKSGDVVLFQNDWPDNYL